MTVRAKFKLASYETRMHRGPRKPEAAAGDYNEAAFEIVECRTLEFLPVCDGSEENKRFFASTPHGSLKLSMINPAAWEQFKLNAEYYLDFVPADA